MIKLIASAKYGYGGKQWIAQITGRAPKVTFARQFVGQKTGKRKDHSEYKTDEPGLYETCDIDGKGQKDYSYCVILLVDDEPERSGWFGRELAAKIATRLESEQIADIVRIVDGTAEMMTPAEARRQKAAASIDEAVSQVLSVLSALPDSQQQKVLTAVRQALKAAPAVPELKISRSDPDFESKVRAFHDAIGLKGMTALEADEYSSQFADTHIMDTLPHLGSLATTAGGAHQGPDRWVRYYRLPDGSVLAHSGLSWSRWTDDAELIADRHARAAIKGHVYHEPLRSALVAAERAGGLTFGAGSYLGGTFGLDKFAKTGVRPNYSGQNAKTAAEKVAHLREFLAEIAGKFPTIAAVQEAHRVVLPLVTDDSITEWDGEVSE